MKEALIHPKASFIQRLVSSELLSSKGFFHPSILDERSLRMKEAFK